MTYLDKRLTRAESRSNGRHQSPVGFGKSPHLSLARLDQAAVRFFAPWVVPALRTSLGVLFIWFGVVKVLAPASTFQMVIGTTSWFPVRPESLVPLLGAVEVVMGVGFLIAKGMTLRLVIIVTILHMLATFTVPFMMPDLVFRDGNPFMLTNAGEYLTKNIVLISAAVALFASTDGSVGRNPSGFRGVGQRFDGERRKLNLGSADDPGSEGRIDETGVTRGHIGV